MRSAKFNKSRNSGRTSDIDSKLRELQKQRIANDEDEDSASSYEEEEKKAG